MENIIIDKTNDVVTITNTTTTTLTVEAYKAQLQVIVDSNTRRITELQSAVNDAQAKINNLNN